MEEDRANEVISDKLKKDRVVGHEIKWHGRSATEITRNSGKHAVSFDSVLETFESRISGDDDDHLLQVPALPIRSSSKVNNEALGGVDEKPPSPPARLNYEPPAVQQPKRRSCTKLANVAANLKLAVANAVTKKRSRTASLSSARIGRPLTSARKGNTKRSRSATVFATSHKMQTRCQHMGRQSEFLRTDAGRPTKIESSKTSAGFLQAAAASPPQAPSQRSVSICIAGKLQHGKLASTSMAGGIRSAVDRLLSRTKCTSASTQKRTETKLTDKAAIETLLQMATGDLNGGGSLPLSHISLVQPSIPPIPGPVNPTEAQTSRALPRAKTSVEQIPRIRRFFQGALSGKEIVRIYGIRKASNGMLYILVQFDNGSIGMVRNRVLNSSGLEMTVEFDEVRLV